jgi:hypothetical protein
VSVSRRVSPRPLARAAALALVLLSAGSAAAAAPRELVLLFTGDNGGEVAPCG